MARNSNNRNNDNNSAEIRILYIEAKNINSDLSGVAQAIASAFRPSAVGQVGSNNAAAALEAKGRNSGAIAPTALPDEEVVDGEVITEEPKRERSTRARARFKGEIDDSISWDGNGTSLVSYVKQRNPQDTIKRFLVIAAWFKRHGGKDSVSANFIYNAYRKMGWSALNDMSQPFRDGSKTNRGYFKRDEKDGTGFYAITGIGLDAADRLGVERTGSEP